MKASGFTLSLSELFLCKREFYYYIRVVFITRERVQKVLRHFTRTHTKSRRILLFFFFLSVFFFCFLRDPLTRFKSLTTVWVKKSKKREKYPQRRHENLSFCTTKREESGAKKKKKRKRREENARKTSFSFAPFRTQKRIHIYIL